MAQLLSFSSVDTALQHRLRNAAPSESVRLAGINWAMQKLYAEFDIESGIRKTTINIVPDGNPIALSTLITDNDYKKASDLRYLARNKHTEEFSFVDDDEFEVHLGQQRDIDEYTIAYNGGVPYLRVNTRESSKRTTMNGMTSLTDNGTWSADTSGSDATTAAATTVLTLRESAALTFNVDVSQSVNNYARITNTTMTSLDLSDYLNAGSIRFWIYIPSVTNFTSVQLDWGNDLTANYWSNTATTQADGSAFIAGWNFVSIEWSGATETGTVTNTAIDSLSVQVNYTASYTDQTSFRVEKIAMFLPIPMQFSYYTYYLSQNASGTYQEELTATATDVLAIPFRYQNLLVSTALQYLAPISFGSEGEQMIPVYEKEAEKEAIKLGLDIGNSPKTASKKMKPRPMV